MEDTGIKVIAFGMIAEITQQDELYIYKVGDTQSLYESLIGLYPKLAQIDFTIAVDRKVAHEVRMLSQINEVALLPPFSGG